MKQKLFEPKDGRNAIIVSSIEEILEYMGELGYSIQSIDVNENGLVIGYIGGQGIVLGQLKDEQI